MTSRGAVGTVPRVEVGRLAITMDGNYSRETSNFEIISSNNLQYFSAKYWKKELLNATEDVQHGFFLQMQNQEHWCKIRDRC